MRESLPENEDRLNQECKRYLLELKRDADESVLYCLQLMEWGLDHNVHVLNSRLRNTLEHLMGESKGEAYQFLKLAGDGKEYDPVPDLESVEGPEDLAGQLIDLLDSKVNLHLRDYPKARELP